MSNRLENIPVVIPPALDSDESELAARNEFLADNEMFDAENFDELQDVGETDDELILDTGDAAPGGSLDQTEAKNLRREKRRKSVMFLLAFGAVFVVFVVFISWAFGFGFFASERKVAVDRNQKTNGVNSSPNENGDEKLKTALAMVANDSGSNQNSPTVSDSLTDPNALLEQDLQMTSGDKTGGQPNNLSSGNMIVLPDETSVGKLNVAQNQFRVAQPSSQGSVLSSPKLPATEVSDTNSISEPKTNNNNGGSTSDKSDGAIARSVFFGSVTGKNDFVSQNSSNNSSRRSASSNKAANVPAFGTLLPVRFLGAIYTLRGTGGLVRMELSRSVKKGGLSYPAGTVIVGRLRGSEYNRAFISIIGAIDPVSGKLVKFEGEILGVDGASGVKGDRKSIKSWGARFLAGLREAGGQAAGVLASRGGRNGTIVLSGTGGLSGEVSSIIRGNSQEKSFVVVRAGTEAYVLITDLPAEKRSNDGYETEKLAETGNGLFALMRVSGSRPKFPMIVTFADIILLAP
ncbi:MAG: hypothetical protein H0W58_06675 [Acidobacteria bacterium]|jgi:hypothetical protein|nr:hypothetical protein [Acidobacteriota bacterium]